MGLSTEQRKLMDLYYQWRRTFHTGITSFSVMFLELEWLDEREDHILSFPDNNTCKQWFLKQIEINKEWCK